MESRISQTIDFVTVNLFGEISIFEIFSRNGNTGLDDVGNHVGRSIRVLS